MWNWSVRHIVWMFIIAYEPILVIAIELFIAEGIAWAFIGEERYEQGGV